MPKLKEEPAEIPHTFTWKHMAGISDRECPYKAAYVDYILGIWATAEAEETYEGWNEEAIFWKIKQTRPDPTVKGQKPKGKKSPV
jgi:hypothetical protein